MAALPLIEQVEALFASGPPYEGHVRQTARQLGYSAAAVGRALRRLERDGRLESRWVGRSRVYRMRRRQMSRLPTEDTRPYFLWDLDLGWTEFRQMLQGPDVATRRWAMERLLSGARWSDIWNLVTLEQVRMELPFLNVRYREVYAELVNPSA